MRFFTISSLRHELSPTRALKWPRRNRVQITRNISTTYYLQHVVLRAMRYVNKKCKKMMHIAAHVLPVFLLASMEKQTKKQISTQTNNQQTNKELKSEEKKLVINVPMTVQSFFFFFFQNDRRVVGRTQQPPSTTALKLD